MVYNKMNYTVREATIPYKPQNGGYNDTITVNNYSKQFYVYPGGIFEWKLPEIFYPKQEVECTLIPYKHTYNNVRVYDENNQILRETQVLRDPLTFTYTVNEDVHVRFHVDYMINNHRRKSYSTWIPVEQKDIRYTISLSKPKLEYNRGNTVVLTCENSRIPIGTKIRFISDNGLDKIGVIKE